MNGAYVLLPMIIKAPNIRRTKMIGVSHYFLLCFSMKKNSFSANQLSFLPLAISSNFSLIFLGIIKIGEDIV